MSKGNYCFVPGCRTGYPTDRKEKKAKGLKVCSLFHPQDDHHLELWKRAIPRADKEITRKHSVCEEHFTVDMIERFFETKLFDGTISKIPRVRPLLKKGAVPCIFKNLPQRFTKTPKTRKSPTERVSLFKKQKVDTDKETKQTEERNGLLNEIPRFTYLELVENIQQVVKPNSWWGITDHPDFVLCVKWDSTCEIEKKVVIDKQLKIKVFFKGRSILFSDEPGNIEHLSSILSKIDIYGICAGADNREVINCEGILPDISNQARGRKKKLCSKCSIFQNKKSKLSSYTRCQKVQRTSWHQRLLNANRKNSRLRQKVIILLNKVIALRKECGLARVDAVNSAISDLPSNQQESVRACLAAAKLQGGNPRSMRYTLPWIYECLLIRIKSRKAYEHLRTHKILTLPSIVTINKYIGRMRGVYGFQKVVFDCMLKKSVHMDLADRRGALLIDEMSVSPNIVFDQNTYCIQGFIDMGKYTPYQDKPQKGDHALVLMFQPFKGTWVQSIACFLSKGAASGTILHHLVMECIILLENSGFFVDAVITDGAAWNRNMWKQFDITTERVSCDHMCDPDRKLWFVSDFPHLIKNVRNAFTSKKFMKLPGDGVVKLEHWEAVLEKDNPKSFTLKVCPKLKSHHLHPQFYQKMNVSMAFQFFSASVAAGMEIYKNDHPTLADCNESVKLIRRFDVLIDIMNSRTPKTALILNSSAEHTLKDFLTFLNDWERYTKQNNCNFISDSTCVGLKVTIKATLEILNFLSNKCGFKYLMTARLNQDSLEKFFGIMRNACGSNDHPNSSLFLQVFRLIGTYSLVRPPRCSNIPGEDLLKTLIDAKDVEDSRKTEFRIKLDSILDGEDINFSIDSLKTDHPYYVANSSPFVINYVGGFVARRAARLSQCAACTKSLTSNVDSLDDVLIDLKNKGGLLKPSKELTNVLAVAEQCTLAVLNSHPVSINTLSNIISEMENRYVPHIGCSQHLKAFTYAVLNYFLVLRMHFICKRENSIDSDKKENTKKLRKKAKLV